MSKNCNPFDKEECEQNTDYHAKEIVFKEKKRVPEYRVKNNSGNFLVKIKVDGCLIEEGAGTRKCDFLMLDCTNNSAFFIELKGQDLGDAVEQIKSTLSILGPKLKNFDLCCRIVQSKVITAIQQRFKKDLVSFLTKNFPRKSIRIKNLVRIESQKLIEIIQ